MIKILLSAALSFSCAAGAATSVPAQIREAMVTGGGMKGTASDGVAVFRGIPFAAPPVGELRWKAPQPVEPWTGTRKANDFAPACMQNVGEVSRSLGSSGATSEDCLYLNVWTAAKSPEERRPVIVYLYGGGFTGGMTTLPLYDGINFARDGVVFVSLAYRVGPFGFLAHAALSRESGRGSGNYGIQDMIAGLGWVRDNIAEFGGDPGCVTLMGQSAGAVAVSMLAASPPARGLFHRAISESGGSFAPPRVAGEAGQNVPTLALAEANGKAFLQKLGIESIDVARKCSAGKLLEGAAAAGPGLFWPVADGDVLPGDQYELYLAGRFNNTPILVGTNSDEGSMFPQAQPTPEMFESNIRRSYGPQADAILKAYPHANGAEASRSAREIRRETTFAWNTWSWARLHSRKGNKAYVYYFDYYKPYTPNGAGHGAEAAYVFGNFSSGGAVPKTGPQFAAGGRLPPGGRIPPGQTQGGFSNPGPSAVDRKLSEVMRGYWVNFARTGDPNGAGLPGWPAFDAAQPRAMVFENTAIGAAPLPNLDKIKAFDPYYERRRMEARQRPE